MKEKEFNLHIVPLRDKMFRYAQSLLLCADEAEDVTHDLLERFWADRSMFANCRNIPAFIMTSVRNRCYDRLRQRQRLRERVGGEVERIEIPTADQSQRWEAREMVRLAMTQLPDRQREVLHLKEIEGYPTNEIAAMILCDEAQVRTILSRARNGLREQLKTMMSDEKRQRTE